MRTQAQTPVSHHLGKAFTLIELLVVVAIIATLISILVPSLSAARRQVRAVKCGTQLREIARGWVIYAADHNDISIGSRPAKLDGDNLYSVGNGKKFRPRWLATLGASVAIYAYQQPLTEDKHQNVDNKLLVCPEVAKWTSERNASYGYNFQFMGNPRLTVSKSGFINFPVKTSRINGDTVLMGDSLGVAANFPASERLPNLPDGTTNVKSLGFHGFNLDPPRVTQGGDYCDDNNRGLRSGPDDRHDRKTNFAFADGHVSALTPESLGYARNSDGSYVHFDSVGLVHNRKFSGTGRDDDTPRVD